MHYYIFRIHASFLTASIAEEAGSQTKNNTTTVVLAQIQDKVKAVRRGATSSSGAIDDNVKCVSLCYM